MSSLSPVCVVQMLPVWQECSLPPCSDCNTGGQCLRSSQSLSHQALCVRLQSASGFKRFLVDSPIQREPLASASAQLPAVGLGTWHHQYWIDGASCILPWARGLKILTWASGRSQCAVSTSLRQLSAERQLACTALALESTHSLEWQAACATR